MNVLVCTKLSDFRETESTILTNGVCAKLLKKANINITEQDVKNAEAIKYLDEK